MAGQGLAWQVVVARYGTARLVVMARRVSARVVVRDGKGAAGGGVSVG